MPTLLLWFISIISIIIGSINSDSVQLQCLADQKIALLELKNNLTFNSAVSKKLVQWDDGGDDCCKWDGVECDASSHVISLQLQDEGISGGIQNLSSTLVSLEYLEKLNLAHNSLHGTMPLSLFTHPSLQQLILSNNKFSGQLHEFPTPNPTNLVVLDLSRNRLEGSVPNSFFNLQSLELLSLSNNLFNASLDLKKIQSLHNLTTLDLSHNNLSVDATTFDSNLSEISKLNKLSLSSCNLHKFPDCIKQFNLRFLDLSDNKITGEIPSWIWEIGNGELYHLNLSYNMLAGLQKPYHIPSFLYELDLSSNQLRGELPLLPRGASYVDYSNNKFDKPIPLNLVSSNFFLIFLSIANNSIRESIPTSICSADTIQVLDFSLNNLSGSIPSCIAERMSSLEVLNLKRNKMSGDIPDNFSRSCRLRFFDLSRNSIGGSLPESLGNCRSLEFVNVERNFIGGSFPCMLASSLKALVVRFNRLEGEVKCGESWGNLQILDASFNSLSGELHSISFSSWNKMMLDWDARTRFNCSGVEVLGPEGLDYSTQVIVNSKGKKYQFSEMLSLFRIIDLSSNKFHGEIPDVIGDLSSLAYLNLSHNALTGIIPKSIGNISVLESLDLSVNQLTGMIPEELTRLCFLSAFNGSHNKLVGKLPMSGQFSAFDNNSYLGNSGLCGFPLSKRCNTNISRDGNYSYSASGRMEIIFFFRLGTIILPWLLS